MTQECTSRRVLRILAIAIFAISLVPKAAFAGDDRSPYAIGLWGDLPYSTVQATVGVPNLIADMNSQNLVFTAHDGALKSGSSECTDAVYTQALGYFGSPSARCLHSGRQRLDRLRPHRRLQLWRFDKERALFLSVPSRSASAACGSRCSRPRSASGLAVTFPASRTAGGPTVELPMRR